MGLGKTFIAGVDDRRIVTPEDAENRDYMSYNKVKKELIYHLDCKTDLLCGLSMKERFKEADEFIKENVDRFKFGEGKSTRYYYNKTQICWIFGAVNLGLVKDSADRYTIFYKQMDIERSGWCVMKGVSDNMRRILSDKYKGVELEEKYNEEMDILMRSLENKMLYDKVYYRISDVKRQMQIVIKRHKIYEG